MYGKIISMNIFECCTACVCVSHVVMLYGVSSNVLCRHHFSFVAQNNIFEFAKNHQLE